MVPGLAGRLFDGLPVAAADRRAPFTPSPLWPGEEACVERAVESRRAEFAQGRTCAREALAALGLAPASIPARRDRSPRWPAGVVGSISHTQSYCIAAVARCAQVRAIGVDAEEARPLERELWATICSERERDAAAAALGLDRGLAVGVLFSVKEAFFKAQFPLTGQFLEFREGVVEFANGAMSFALLRDAGPFPSGPTPFELRVVIEPTTIATCTFLRAP